MMVVTVIIPTYNEEVNIRYAIESVLWVEKVFVVDSFSTDRTVEIAKEYAPKVEVVQHKWEGYAKQKNWALDNLPIPTDWVLFLDADEMVPERLKNQILKTISSPNACDAYWIPFKVVFLGKVLRFCAGTYVLRLFRKGKVRWEEREVHEHPIVDGKVGYLNADICHHDRKPLWFFLDRHNKYSDLEAKERFNAWYGESGKRQLKGRLFGTKAERIRFIKERIWRLLPPPFRWATRFVWNYFIRFGFLDGMPGLFFCLHKAVQEFYTDMKMYELHLRKRQKK